MLRDQLLNTEDWDAAGHAYADEHDRYAGVKHAVNLWFSELYLETGSLAGARPAPRAAFDRRRPQQPDAGFSGPDTPVSVAVKKRFFGED